MASRTMVSRLSCPLTWISPRIILPKPGHTMVLPLTLIACLSCSEPINLISRTSEQRECAPTCCNRCPRVR